MPISAPPSLNNGVNFDAPVADGTDGQPMLTDGLGQLRIADLPYAHISGTPDLSAYVLKAGSTMTGPLINSTDGTASTASLKLTGSAYTAGDGTTNFPLFLIQPDEAIASVDWSFDGTYFGIDGAPTFTGNFIDCKLGDTLSSFWVTYTGQVNANGAQLTGNLTWNLTTVVGLQLNNLTTTQGNALGAVAGGSMYYDSVQQRVRIRESSTWYNYVRLSGDTMTGALQFSGTTHAGLKLNSLTTIQRNAISSPSAGMLIYNSTLGNVNYYNGSLWSTGWVERFTTVLKTADYSALANEYVAVDTTSGNVIITLPTAPTNGTQIGVKHVVKGGSNVVTVSCSGSDHFNTTTGGTSGTLTYTNQAFLLNYDSTRSVWTITADDIPLSQLDLRYLALTGGTLTGDLLFSGTSHAGLVLNSLTTTQRDAISSPVNGSLIYNSTTGRLNAYLSSAWTAGYVRLDGDTMTGALVNSTAGTASTAILSFTGIIFTGGSGTTNFPHIFIQPTGTTAVTTWSTAGTGFGLNLASGFTGNFVDYHLGGAASVFKVNYLGGLTMSSTLVNATVAAVATPALRFTGSPYRGAGTTGSECYPQLLFQDSGATDSTTWNSGATGGTYIGINQSSTVSASARALDIRTNGGASVFYIKCTGEIGTVSYNWSFAGATATYAAANNNGTFSHKFTSGAQNPTSGTTEDWQHTSSFTPTSGTAAYIGMSLTYTINQTGGANGDYTGLRVKVTETAAGGTNKRLLDLLKATTSQFYVDSSGNSVQLGVKTIAGSPAVSTAALLLSGTLQVTGSGTTNFPMLLFQTGSASAVTDWANGTNIGTYIGINSDSATTINARIFDIHRNGGGSLFGIYSNGRIKLTTLSGTVAGGGSVAASSVPIEFGFNDYGLSYDSSSNIYVVQNQVAKIRLGINAVVTSTGYYGWTTTTHVGTSAVLQAVIRSPANWTYTLGDADAASPSAQILSVQNVVAGTSNTAGVNFTINGSIGTGTGAGGSLIFKVAPAGSTGTSQNTLSTVLTMDSTLLSTFGGGIKTSAPSGGTAATWKHGVKVDAVVAFDTAKYIQIDVDGVAYKLALAS